MAHRLILHAPHALNCSRFLDCSCGAREVGRCQTRQRVTCGMLTFFVDEEPGG